MSTEATGAGTRVAPASTPRILGRAAVAALIAPLRGQATEAIRRAPRLPAPTGPTEGVTGQGGPYRRLLVIGESTAAGIGASRHDRALPGFLAAEMIARHGGTVAWTVRAKGGVTARRVLAELAPAGAGPFDVTVLTVGVNDLFDRRDLRAWASDLRRLVDALAGEDGRTRLIVSAMPPLHRLPAIPQPLRFVAGCRARTMNRVTRRVATVRGASYVPLTAQRGAGSELFAADGFHPSEAGYRQWARMLAQALPD